MEIVKTNPIRYLNSVDLREIISSECSTAQSDIPTVPADNTSQPRVGAEKITTIDVDEEAQSYNNQSKKTAPSSTLLGEVVLYAVSKPLDDCQNCNYRCTACGINWSNQMIIITRRHHAGL